MSADFEHARLSLGARLRELRTDAGVNGRDLAARLDWPASKVSKLEHGKQAPTPEELQAWAEAVGRPEAAAELKLRLQGLGVRYRTWTRVLAGGHLGRQEVGVRRSRATTVTTGYEPAVVPGIFQIAGYARHVLTHASSLHGGPGDIDEGVRARLKRQDCLYHPTKRFRFVMSEAALYVRICPPEVLAAQLDRLGGLLGLDTVELGIVPLGAPVTVVPKHGFWIYDNRFVTVETWNAEMWLDQSSDIELYRKVWEKQHEAAVYGHAAHRLIARARSTLAAG
ncbi:helix-turn-helix transcriptional regulator [Kitasatospora sp. SUK 42]|uniref:helix-turn-helix domain-containing protein n=1 Tax=Kitasatospora sp. SUK 42 TaxID=1588882 RepID=UPI0018CAA9BA|nr:helix-turn-helix transcriptional regulator [Kitasatospora sp. SUK 42]MBV2154113.1 helix-turn-helix transcriptional regulator [Kitasatospora sp. SUK 42]